ncbi:MAG: iron-sulfur cluster insertion protein ErpA [Alphaproteobacteria bacterium]|nr:iron-sulfur cluster insertion protein ErpA [Alphaproteobacteria bacterium]
MPDGHPASVQAFDLTESAARRVGALLRDEQAGGDGAPTYMRVSVEGGGCSGFQYNFSLEARRENDDLAFERDGVTVLVDPVSLDLVRGGVLDYVEELIGSYFQITNPNAASSCGCGTSFSIRDPEA